jgi:hypothetical protein
MLSVDKEVAEFFKTKEYFPKQEIIKTQKNGDLILKTILGRYEEITHTIFSWILFIKIVAPETLKNRVLQKLYKYFRFFKN